MSKYPLKHPEYKLIIYCHKMFKDNRYTEYNLHISQEESEQLHNLMQQNNMNAASEIAGHHNLMIIFLTQTGKIQCIRCKHNIVDDHGHFFEFQLIEQ